MTPSKPSPFSPPVSTDPIANAKTVIAELDTLISNLEDAKEKLAYYNTKRDELYSLIQQYSDAVSESSSLLTQLTDPTIVTTTLPPNMS